jgi:hypothetical protein
MPEAQEQTRATPGPWRVGTSDDLEYIRPEAMVLDANGEPIADCDVFLTAGRRNKAEAEANARLCVAARTMFDALEAAPIIRLGESFDEFAVRFKQWHREVRVPAVNLAKAEGR